MRLHKAAVVSLMALQLAACGGDSGVVNSTPTPTPTPAPSPTPVALSASIPASVQQALQSAPLNAFVAFNDGTVRFASGAISYNSGTNTYAVSNVYTVPASFSDSNATTGPVAGLKYFSIPDPVNSSLKDTIVVLDNTKLSSPLKYTSAAAAVVPSASAQPLAALVFGSPTASIPAIGVASFSGVTTGLAKDSTSTYVLSGTSSLLIDFATGAVRTQLNYNGTNMTQGGAGLAQQNFSGGGTLGSGQYTGNLAQVGGSGSGVFAGRFYGPNVDEYGFSFSVLNGSLTVAGAAIGAAQSPPTASALPQWPSAINVAGNIFNNAYQASGYNSSIPIGNAFFNPGVGITYNPSTGTYDFGPNNFSGGTNAVTTFGQYGPSDFKSMDATQSTYQHADPNFPSQVDKLVLYTPASNAALNLTYTGYFLFSNPQTSSVMNYAAGVFTANSVTVVPPASGTGSYAGTVAGYGQDSAKNLYTLSGQASLSVNFATQTYTTNLTFTPTLSSGPGGLPMQTFSGGGAILTSGAGKIFSDPINGTGSTTGSGYIGGMLTGPNAEEFGYHFATSAVGLQTTGAAIGKR